MDAATGDITIPSTDELIGFHVLEDGSIRGISHRTAATVMAEGTNFTELIAAGGVDSTLVNGAAAVGDTMWFDLALRMEISDMSSNTANGHTEFFYRGPTNKPLGTNPGKNQFTAPEAGYRPWRRHPTALLNQTPNSNQRALVPTIETINGPTNGDDGVVFVDWWSFGRSRVFR